MKLFYDDYYGELEDAIHFYRNTFRGKARRKAALRLVIKNALYLLKLSIPRRQKAIAPQGAIRIAFLPGGGFGDYLLFANWYAYFLERFQAADMQIDIYLHIRSAHAIFQHPLPKTTIKTNVQDTFDEDAYDVIFRFIKWPDLRKFDHARVAGEEALFLFIASLEAFRERNFIIFENHPLLDGMASARSIARGVKRIQEADVTGDLGIQEKYHYPLAIEEDEEAYLASLGLQDRPFITVHRGWDASGKQKDFHVKGWSLKSCGDLIPELKKNYPEYQIVIIGANDRQAPVNRDGADLDLIGKTSLEQVKVLLKHSAVHIDNEGGLVHLRHALHGRTAIVLFGATAPELFGYTENINLCAHACPVWCEWLTPDWAIQCSTGAEGAPCMEAITTKDILAAVGEAVKKK